ncbi:hypothetical protein ACSYDW_07160 [Paeniglutamicibacter sp. R2-26]|uniref:hypothetical protein n=1 Tax=Paeniglutamicibacter sp. R2-26 TaxID=3144417 RepID=UPI003EE691C8
MTTISCDTIPDQANFLTCNITEAATWFPPEIASALIGLLGVAVGTISTIVYQGILAAKQQRSEQQKRLSSALTKSFSVRNLMKHIWMVRDLPPEEQPQWEVISGQLNDVNADFAAFQEIMHEIQLLDDDKTVEMAEDLFDSCVVARNYFLEAHKNGIEGDERETEWNRRLAQIEPNRVQLRKHARASVKSGRLGIRANASAEGNANV